MITAIANNKGGCGKTTTAVNLAAALRLRGYSVLLVDLDGQTNLTTSLGVPPGISITINTYQALHSLTPPPPATVIPQDVEAGRLDILPASRDLSAIDGELMGDDNRILRLNKILEAYRGRYDHIILDTPPALGILTISALYAADAVIIPMLPHFLAVQGLVTMSEAVGKVAASTGRRLPLWVLFTQYDKRKSMHRLTAQQVEEAGFDTFNTRIRDNVALGEAPAAATDVFRYSPSCKGAEDYRQLADEYINITRV